MPSGRLNAVTVCPWKLRAWFNGYQVVKRVASGQIIASVKVNTPHTRPPAGLAAGTSKRIIEYRNRRSLAVLAYAHVTVCRHGAILRSGFPDPKSRFMTNEIQQVVVDHPDDENYTCGPRCAADRQRSKIAESALEKYRESCAQCEPK